MLAILAYLVAFLSISRTSDGFRSQWMPKIQTKTVLSISNNDHDSLPSKLASSKRAIASIFLSSLLLMQGSPFSAVADESEPVAIVAESTTSTSTLSAKDVLARDIQPRVDALKDIFFIFKLFPVYIDQGDYQSIRKGFRQEPAVMLRKTCKYLEKYLSVEEKKNFNAAYLEMIDAVDNADSLALRRVKESSSNKPSTIGLTGPTTSAQPAAPPKDTEMIAAVDKVITKFDTMLRTVNAYKP